MSLYLPNIYIHYIELKFRTIYFFISFIFVFSILFYFKIELFFYISEFFLLKKNEFIYNNLLDPFIIYIKLSFFYSILLIIPIGFYFYFFFIAKALYNIYIHIMYYLMSFLILFS